jgi:hypothetical protein
VFISKGAQYRHVPAWRERERERERGKKEKGFTRGVEERGWVLSEGADVALSGNLAQLLK